MKRQILTKSLSGLLLAGTLAGAASGYDWRSVVVGGGGYVDGFAFHPKVKGLMYARTDMGGAYRWNPTASSWTPLTDWIGTVADNMGILSVALDPSDASKLYLLTGKYTNANSGEYGCVLRSSDTGRTFAKTQLHLKNGSNMDGRGSGERLAVDPNKGSILLLAGSAWDTSKDGTRYGTHKGALWMSKDGGATFDSIKTGPTTTGNGLFALFDPSTGTAGSATQTIYVGMDKSNNGAAALWRSTNGGATWNVVPGTPAGLLPSSAALVGRNLYVSFNNGLGPNGITSGKLMRMNTQTDAWTDVSPEKNAAYGYGTPAPSPRNGSLAIGSVDRWGAKDDIWISRDSGATWSSKLLSGTLDNSFAPWKGVRTPHWISAVQIDPFDSTHALFGTGYGVYRTTNLTASKATWSAADSNLEETVPLQLVSPPSGAPLLSAMGDQGGFRHVSLSKAPLFAHIPDVGTTLSIDLAWLNTASLVKTNKAANSAGTGGGYSQDSGKTWKTFATQPSGIVFPSAANDYNGEGGGTRTVAVNADGTRIVWIAPKTAGAYLSRDNGATWTKSTGPAPVAGSATPIGDKVNPAKMYVLNHGGGNLLVSTDSGASFVVGGSVTKLDAWEAANSAIATVPGYEGHVLAATDHPWGGGGLYLSTNSGTTTTKVSTVSGATRVAVGKAAPGKAFPAVYIVGSVGGTYGFWRSDDSLKTWTRINTDQQLYGIVHHIAGDPNVYGRVYLATEGRGIVYGQPVGTVEPVGIGAMQAAASASLLRQGSRLVSRQGAAISLYDLGGRLVRSSSSVSGMDLTGLPRGLYLARSAGSSLGVTLAD